MQSFGGSVGAFVVVVLFVVVVVVVFIVVVVVLFVVVVVGGVGRLVVVVTGGSVGSDVGTGEIVSVRCFISRSLHCRNSQRVVPRGHDYHNILI